MVSPDLRFDDDSMVKNMVNFHIDNYITMSYNWVHEKMANQVVQKTV